MNETKIQILEKAMEIIEDDIDDELNDWLLNYSEGRPSDAVRALDKLVCGLKEHKRKESA